MSWFPEIFRFGANFAFEAHLKETARENSRRCSNRGALKRRVRRVGRGHVMHLNYRSRASLSLVGGILGMVAQERLSLISSKLGMSAAFALLAVSVGLLLFSQRASFRAGYEQARRDATAARS